MEFPGNSKNVTGGPDEKPPEKKIEKVVSTEVVKRPKSIGRRFRAIFFGGEFKNVLRYIAADVLLPSIRNMIWDTGSEGLKRMIYGEASSVMHRRPAEYRPRIQYDNPINRAARDPRVSHRTYLPDQPAHVPRGSRYNVGDLIFGSRDEAALVLERLGDIIDKYGVASVGDLNELSGLSSTYVDNKWGWFSLNNVSIHQTREGFIIDLPIVEPID